MSTLTKALLPSDPEQHQLCTTCGQRQDAHPFNHPMLVGRCLEWRNAPDDTVLACLLRLLRMCRPTEVHDEAGWRARLQAMHIPADVPWVRWEIAIARVLASVGILTELAVSREDPPAPRPSMFLSNGRG